MRALLISSGTSVNEPEKGFSYGSLLRLLCKRGLVAAVEPETLCQCSKLFEEVFIPD